MREYLSDGIEVLGMAAVAYGLFTLAFWAGIIATGIFLVVIGMALGGKE